MSVYSESGLVYEVRNYQTIFLAARHDFGFQLNEIILICREFKT